MPDWIKKALWNNVNLKIMSFILGCGCWYIVSLERQTSLWVSVPVCFDELTDTSGIRSPEKVHVQLQAKRSDLYALNLKELALHIGPDELGHERNHIKISEEKLFLPRTVKLVNCTPLNLIVYKEIQTT